MGRHAVMRHGAPGMIVRRRLRKPDVARIACKLPAFQRSHDCVAITDFPTRSINQIGAALHLRQQSVVKEVLSLGMQGRYRSSPRRRL